MRDIRSITKRIEELKKLLPEDLEILIEVEGEQKVIYVEQLKEYPNADFIRVVAGNNLKDVDRLLEIHIDSKI